MRLQSPRSLRDFSFTASVIGDEAATIQALAHSARAQAYASGVKGMSVPAAIVAGLLFAGPAGMAFADAGPEVKKSQSGICHGQDSVHYERTKKFTPYDSMEECIGSGGRESRGARRASPWRWVAAAGALIVLTVFGWLWMRRKPA